MEELQGSLGIMCILLIFPVLFAADIMFGFKGAFLNSSIIFFECQSLRHYA
jgi:hypothetical protein